MNVHLYPEIKSDYLYVNAENKYLEHEKINENQCSEHPALSDAMHVITTTMITKPNTIV